ncbi:uncharacterized protein EDB91DRAFT_1134250 [Suillus paluster]|uniref:uncharacterized protein n=1 Tax=Suillus paluster TaxID=48578 RepID=UPI001B875DA0|nr:uncharacterized protein EDB91DRAFT_1134250 [Suillus paluster]KAG1739880.1 hypothetical protein EDB91DRAFT_1134250 [Suillus paluster]
MACQDFFQPFMLDTIVISQSARRALNIGKQSQAGALGLLIYEHIITIEDEVDLIWMKRTSWVTYLYHFNRWLPASWLIFDIIQLSPTNVASSKTCVTYMLCNNIIALLMTISVQTILQLRAWAIYGRSRRVFFWMIGLSIIEITAMALLIGVTIARVERFPVVSTPVGCVFEGLAPLSAIFWTPALVIEPIICILVLKKVLLDRQARSELAMFLARDSLLYFLVIFMELVASTVVWARFPDYIDLFMPWSMALPSLLCNRLLLNMRGRFARDSEPLHSSIELVTIQTSPDSSRADEE